MKLMYSEAGLIGMDNCVDAVVLCEGTIDECKAKYYEENELVDPADIIYVDDGWEMTIDGCDDFYQVVP